MSNVNNVTYGKPRIGGAIFSAPLGTKLPLNAKEELDPKFKCLGYVSDDGLSNKNSIETKKINAWGGDTVIVLQTSKEDLFTYKLIEVMNVDVLKEVYGSENVSGSIEEGITVKANSKPLKTRAIVIDMILKGGALKRIVIPNGEISEIGEIEYADEDAVGYELTLNALADTDGNTHYEYISKGV